MRLTRTVGGPSSALTASMNFRVAALSVASSAAAKAGRPDCPRRLRRALGGGRVKIGDGNRSAGVCKACRKVGPEAAAAAGDHGDGVAQGEKIVHAGLSGRAGKMVGATGIEPVTPTMSR